MIPTDSNPHGLEEVTIRFHVLRNLMELQVYSVETKGRLYCYAEYPPDLTVASLDGHFIPSTMPASENGHYGPRWIPKLCMSKSEYDQEMTNNSYTTGTFMLNKIPRFADEEWSKDDKDRIPYDREEPPPENYQDFYREEFNLTDGLYATVFVIDTSGSMDSGDYDKCKMSLTSALRHYSAIENANPKLWVYSGTYDTNLESKQLADMNVSSSNVDTVYSISKKVIDNIAKYSSSEAMLTCLYVAMNDILGGRAIDGRQLLRFDSNATSLRGITFVLLTDESVTTSDSLDGYGNVVKNDAKHKWIYKWQNGSDANHQKLPYQVKADQVKKIHQALKQMSYYYGVNVTWGLTRGLSGGDYTTFNTTVPYLKHYGKTKDIPNDGTVWEVPSGCVHPFEALCQAQFMLPAGCTMVSGKVMVENDLYKGAAHIKSKFHKMDDTGRNYCTYRYFGETVTMPKVSCPSAEDDIITFTGLAVPEGKRLSGWVWKTIQGGTYSDIAPGTVYTLTKENAPYDTTQVFSLDAVWETIPEPPPDPAPVP